MRVYMIEIKEEKGTTRAGQITELLHRSFAEHQCRGLVFEAAVQNEAITCQRMQSGTCLVAEKDNRLVGTVIVSFFVPPLPDYWPNRDAWYFKVPFAEIGQLAVDPTERRSGIGKALLQKAEELCDGKVDLICLNTALPAREIISFYKHCGYVTMGACSWAATPYNSIILVKPLSTQAKRQSNSLKRWILYRKDRLRVSMCRRFLHRYDEVNI